MNQDEFDKLLSWLDPDRDRAGQKYEDIRRVLKGRFERRGCNTPDELVDETIDRVIQKLPEMVDTYVGNPALYFYGVAKNIYREWLKKKADYSPPLPQRSPEDTSEEEELRYWCLEQCLETLDKSSREFIIAFHEMEGRERIEHRKEMARRLNITVHALRMRAHRIKEQLHVCIEECLKQI